MQVNLERERIMNVIERKATRLIERGDVAKWFEGCDPDVRKVGLPIFHASILLAVFSWKVSEGVNGPLLACFAETAAMACIPTPAATAAVAAGCTAAGGGSAPSCSCGGRNGWTCG